MTKKVDEIAITKFWNRHKLEEHIAFESLSEGADNRSTISVRFLCCNGAPTTKSWNTFRRAIEAGGRRCFKCHRRKTVAQWRSQFERALRPHPNILQEWEVLKATDGTVVLQTICRCGKGSSRPARLQALKALRNGTPLCRFCATVNRSAAIKVSDQTVLESLKTLSGFPHVGIRSFGRDEHRQWTVQGVCQIEGCGKSFSQLLGNFKKSLKRGRTGCKDCSVKGRVCKPKVKPEEIFEIAAQAGKANCFKPELRITLSRGKSWVEASCNMPGCVGKIFKPWSSIRNFLKSASSNGCDDCIRRARLDMGPAQAEVLKLLHDQGLDLDVEILELNLVPNSKRKVDGTAATEISLTARCLKPGCGSRFTKLLGDARKSWTLHETNGCPACGRAVNGLRHRKSIDHLRDFVNEKAIGPSVDILTLRYVDKKGVVKCRCLHDSCNHVWEQQVGVLKDKLPKGANGCPMCWRARSSTGEVMVAHLLQGLSLRSEQMCDAPIDLWTSGIAWVDFVVGEAVTIEVHGLQHFEYVPKFHHHNLANFGLQQSRDAWKRRTLNSTSMALIEVDMRMVGNQAEMAEQLRAHAQSLLLERSHIPGRTNDVLQKIMDCCSIVPHEGAVVSIAHRQSPPNSVPVLL